MRLMRSGSPPSSGTCRWPSPGGRVHGRYRMAAGDFLRLLRTRAGRLLTQGAPGSYPRLLAPAAGLVADGSLAGPGRGQAGQPFAFLACGRPRGPVRRRCERLSRRAGQAGCRPAGLAADLRPDDEAVTARIGHRGLPMHRLPQAILRDRLPPARPRRPRVHRSDPGRQRSPRPANPATWPRWARLMPHLLAADLVATDSPALREQTAARACPDRARRSPRGP